MGVLLGQLRGGDDDGQHGGQQQAAGPPPRFARLRKGCTKTGAARASVLRFAHLGLAEGVRLVGRRAVGRHAIYTLFGLPQGLPLSRVRCSRRRWAVLPRCSGGVMR